MPDERFTAEFADDAPARVDSRHFPWEFVGRPVRSFSDLICGSEFPASRSNAGDITGDGKADVASGRCWYAAPDLRTRHEIHPVKPQNRVGYAATSSAGYTTTAATSRTTGSPAVTSGKPGSVYETPGAGGYDPPWKRHQVLRAVSNESPQFVYVVGSDQLKLVLPFLVPTRPEAAEPGPVSPPRRTTAG